MAVGEISRREFLRAAASLGTGAILLAYANPRQWKDVIHRNIATNATASTADAYVAISDFASVQSLPLMHRYAAHYPLLS